MDIRARSILSQIRTYEGSENAVIAGGAIRDTFFGAEVKDYDIFLPKHSFNNASDRLTKLDKGIGNTLADQTHKYKNLNTSVSRVYTCDYQGIRLNLIASRFINETDFPMKVVSEFDYGLNMGFLDEGDILKTTEEFDKDANDQAMTLLNLEGLSYLAKALQKFNYMNEKLSKVTGHAFLFKSPRLIWVPKEKAEDDTGVRRIIERVATVNEARRDRVNVAGLQVPFNPGAAARLNWNIQPEAEEALRAAAAPRDHLPDPRGNIILWEPQPLRFGDGQQGADGFFLNGYALGNYKIGTQRRHPVDANRVQEWRQARTGVMPVWLNIPQEDINQAPQQEAAQAGPIPRDERVNVAPRPLGEILDAEFGDNNEDDRDIVPAFLDENDLADDDEDGDNEDEDED